VAALGRLGWIRTVAAVASFSPWYRGGSLYAYGGFVRRDRVCIGNLDDGLLSYFSRQVS